LSTTQWLQVTEPSIGPVAPGTAASFSSLAGGVFNTVAPTLTNGQQAALQLTAAGALITTTILIYDTNFGTVGANTLRVAAELGNATGSLDYGNGATGAQTLRVAANQGAPNTIGNAWPVKLTDGTNTASITAAGEVKVDITQPLPTGTNIIGSVNQGTSPWVISGTVAATQSGAWTVAATQSGSWTVAATQSGTWTVGLSEDHNYGTVGANTLRTASQIGNATGGADFNAGATGAQTLRVVANQGAPNTAANAWTVALTSGGALNSPTNPIFVSQSDIPGTAVDVYTDSASVAKGATATIDYPVTAAKTFYTKQHYATASGLIKLEVEYETASGSGIFNHIWVGFNSSANPMILIPVPTSKSQVAGARIRYIVTNLDKGAMDIYTTLSGIEQ
jgi:hypothetical protein